MKLLRTVIRGEIHSTAEEIRRLKWWWRMPDDHRVDRLPPETRFPLAASKRRATLLCMLMAHSRGRKHLGSHADLAEQARVLAEELAKMDEMRLVTPLLDDALRATGRAILERGRRMRA
jgi:hypothetical protein